MYCFVVLVTYTCATIIDLHILETLLCYSPYKTLNNKYMIQCCLKIFKYI